MIAFLSLVLHVAVSPFKTKARLEAEILMLRQRPNGPPWAGAAIGAGDSDGFEAAHAIGFAAQKHEAWFPPSTGGMVHEDCIGGTP
jgi:hypothetical protein